MMKTNYLTVMALSLLAALSGCQAEEEAQDKPQTAIPVGLSGDVAQARAEFGSAADLTAIGVFAYFTNGAFSEGNATPNFMYNQQVERQSDGSWTYSPVKYWPNNTTDRISFFAYAPYVDETPAGGSNPTISGNTATGFPKLTYTVPAAENNQVDLLASVPLMNQTYGTSGGTANGSLKFAMKHALTKITFSAKSEMKIKVTSLTVNTAPATATLTFTDSGFGWGTYTGTQTFTATLDSGGTEVTANATDTTTLATFFLLPDKASATFSLSYVQDGETAAATKTNVALPLTWTQGGNVNYVLNVKKDGLSVAAIQSNEWTGNSSTDEAIDSKVPNADFKADVLKLGDYYYSDGTTSDGGYRKYTNGTTAHLPVMPVLTDKDGNARSVVGIVLLAGRHYTDAADYRSTGIEEESNIAGYAVALQSISNVAWCNKSGEYNVGTSTNTNDWQGFYNQQQIEAYAAANGWAMSSFPAANACKNYTPAAPATSSGWFLASNMQVKAICYELNILNASFLKAKGAEIYGGYNFWVSTEYDGNYSFARHIYMTAGNESFSLRSKGNYVRPMLAFR